MGLLTRTFFDNAVQAVTMQKLVALKFNPTFDYKI